MNDLVKECRRLMSNLEVRKGKDYFYDSTKTSIISRSYGNGNTVGGITDERGQLRPDKVTEYHKAMEMLPFVASLALLHIAVMKEQVISGHTYANYDDTWATDMVDFANQYDQ